MRRDKAVTRILLILSVVHVAASAPAIIRQRSLEVIKDVTPALEKRAYSDDGSSHAFPRMNNILPTTSGTVPSHDDTPAAPGDPQLHSDPSPELGTPQLNIDQTPTSGTPQLHDDPPPTPGALPSQEDPLPVSGTPQLHNGEPPTPGAPTSQGDDPSPWQQHANLRPPGEMLQGESSVVPQSDDDPWSDMHHTDWRSPLGVLRGELSAAPSIHVPAYEEEWHWESAADDLQQIYNRIVGRSPGTSETSSEAPELQND